VAPRSIASLEMSGLSKMGLPKTRAREAETERAT
jgi:hypothetical protein